MATREHPSELLHPFAYPCPESPYLRNDSRIASFLNEEKEQPVSSKPEKTKKDALIFHSLVVSGEKLTPRNPLATVASLIFQLFILAAVVVVPLFHLDPFPKMDSLTMLYLPSPPGPPARATNIEAPRPRSKYTPKSASVRLPVPMKQEAPPPPLDTNVVGGVPGGVAGGLPGGVLGEMGASLRSVPLASKASGPTPLKRVRIASRVAEANLIHNVPPQYPPEAGRERIEGTVVLMAVIGADGSVKELQVESGLPVLAQAAVEAVKQWRYKPYLLNATFPKSNPAIALDCAGWIAPCSARARAG